MLPYIPQECIGQPNKNYPAYVAQWIEHGPANQRVASSIPSQGTCPDCRPGPLWGARERQPHIDVSLLFLLPFPSL